MVNIIFQEEEVDDFNFIGTFDKTYDVNKGPVSQTDECGICLTEFNKGERVVILKCTVNKDENA